MLVLMCSQVLLFCIVTPGVGVLVTLIQINTLLVEMAQAPGSANSLLLESKLKLQYIKKGGEKNTFLKFNVDKLNFLKRW
jgi:hypothetical protein